MTSNHSIHDNRLNHHPATSPLFTSTLSLSQELSWWERVNPEKRLLTGKAYHISKRIMDIGLILVGFPFILPLLGLCALLIKIESSNGPVLFLQKRTGINGKLLDVDQWSLMSGFGLTLLISSAAPCG